MKQSILVALIMTLFSMPIRAQDIHEVSINWEEGLKPPYLMLNDKKQPTGIAVDMITEILLTSNIRPKHKFVPWLMFSRSRTANYPR